MLTKTMRYVFSVVFLILICNTFSFSSDPGPEQLTLKSIGSNKTSPAVFPHLFHQKSIECGVCHHGMTDTGKKIPYDDKLKIQKCEKCHNVDVMAGKIIGKYNLDDFKGAGHASCLECHKDMASKDPAMEKLKSCKICHKK